MNMEKLLRAVFLSVITVLVIIFGGLYIASETAYIIVEITDSELVKKRNETTTAIIKKCREAELVRYQSYNEGMYDEDYMFVFSDDSQIPLDGRFNYKQTNKLVKKCFEHLPKNEQKKKYEYFKFN